LRCAHLLQCLPQLFCGGARGDLLEDVLGEGGDDVAEDLLIECQPSRVLRVRLLLGVGAGAGGDLLSGSTRAAVDEAREPCTTDRRKDLQLPQGIVGLGELLSHGMAKGGRDHGAGGARHGRELEIR
jgi:hypothetical protein